MRLEQDRLLELRELAAPTASVGTGSTTGVPGTQSTTGAPGTGGTTVSAGTGSTTGTPGTGGTTVSVGTGSTTGAPSAGSPVSTTAIPQSTGQCPSTMMIFEMDRSCRFQFPLVKLQCLVPRLARRVKRQWYQLQQQSCVH